MIDTDNPISVAIERTRVIREGSLPDSELVASRAAAWRDLVLCDDWPCIEELASRAGVDVPAIIREHNAVATANGGVPVYSDRTWDEEIEAAERMLGPEATEKEARELALRRFWCLEATGYR